MQPWRLCRVFLRYIVRGQFAQLGFHDNFRVFDELVSTVKGGRPQSIIESLQAIRQTLQHGGILAIWSAWFDPKFIQQLKKAGYKVKDKTVRAHKGKGSRHTIYLARKIQEVSKGE